MRSIWTGAISFGLIYIPVRLYSATETSELELDMLRKGDLCPIRYVRVCKETGEEVPYADIVKGYQWRKGDYVVVSDQDFKKAAPKKTQTVEIVQFIQEDEVDPKLLEKPYYLEPSGKGAGKAYALLRDALAKTGKVAVARYVLRTRESMALLKAEDDMIVLINMRYASEIRKPTELDLPGKEEVQKKELDMAVKLIEQLTEPFQPDQYKDSYVEALMKFIEEKAKGKEPQAEEDTPVPAEVTDLFAKLRQSLELAENKGK